MGCRAPLVLRKGAEEEGGGYLNLGDAYVDGFIRERQLGILMMGSRDSKSSSFIEVGLSVCMDSRSGLRNFWVHERVNKTMVISTWRLNRFGD